MGNLKLVKLLDPLQIVNIPSGLVPRGAYGSGTDYAVGDSVSYNGSSYVMFNDAPSGTIPTNTTYWQVLANKGDSGGGGGGGAVDSVNGQTGTVVLTQDDVGDGTTYKQYSSTEKTKLAGIATGANVGVVPNGAITGATKTKITYDTKGLVTAGADATTADIADSSNKRYVTDAQLVVIGNTSGTNTGDQTTVTGNAGTATTLATARTIGTLTGDVTTAGSSFNGSANNTNATVLATVNSNVGSFTNASVTVNAKGLVTAASSGATPEVPLTFSTGLTRSTNTITVNTSQNIAKLSNLTSNGLVKTSGSDGTLSIATSGTDYQAPLSLTTTGTSGAATLIGTTLNIPQYTGGGGGSGITRSVSTITSSVTIGASSSTDYVVFVGASGAPILPTAVSNTNRYTIKNVDTSNKTVATTSSQTIDGSTTITLTPNTSVDVISDNSNWRIV